jgi:hypothetical protein
MLREGSDYLCARKSTGAFARFCEGAILITVEFYQISDHNHAFAAKTIVLTLFTCTEIPKMINNAAADHMRN